MFSKAFLLLVGVAAVLDLVRSQTTTVQIEGSSPRTVLESAGSIAVCVVMTNGQTGDSVTFNFRTIESTAIGGVDFRNVIVQETVTTASPRICINVEILDNGIETGDALRFSANIDPAMTTSIEVITSPFQIDIQDTDKVLVGFTKSTYQVTEGMSFQVCVVLLNGTIAADVDIDLQYTLNQTELPLDIMTVNQDFVLSDTSNTSCISFATSDNQLIQGSRYHTINLIATDIPVKFRSDQATIEVLDDDVATLSLVGNTSRVVIEGNFGTTTVETICLNLVSVDSGLERDIVVNVTTLKGTATAAGSDYKPVMDILTIPQGTTLDSFKSSSYCVNVTIIGDNLRELNESFIVVFNAYPDIFQGADNVTITILDDGDVNECTVLLSPANGMVDLQNGTDIGSVAKYSCITDRFRLIPETSRRRTCGMDNWDGVDPSCVAVCEALGIQNGMVRIPGDISCIKSGTVATHLCNMNFFLDGNQERTCMGNGFWSGVVPVCREINCVLLPNPGNGSVVHSGTDVGSVATYSCFIGFTLVGGGAGGDRRVCSTDGKWTGTAPICIAVCEALDIQNGTVRIPGDISCIKSGTVAIHFCNMNFFLDGNQERTCMGNGFWSGVVPVCREINCVLLPNPASGSVVHTGTTVGSVATYSCFKGFTLVGGGAGGDRRVCSTDGKWTGTAPTCSGASRLIGSQAVLLFAVAAVFSAIFHAHFSL